MMQEEMKKKIAGQLEAVAEKFVEDALVLLVAAAREMIEPMQSELIVRDRQIHMLNKKMEELQCQIKTKMRTKWALN